MMKNKAIFLVILALLPFILWLVLALQGSIKLNTILVGILLFVTSYGVLSSNKKWIVMSRLSLLIICSVFFIAGFKNDYFRMVETYTAIVMFIYYGILHLLNKRRFS